jgi:hypothetical protein
VCVRGGFGLCPLVCVSDRKKIIQVETNTISSEVGWEAASDDTPGEAPLSRDHHKHRAAQNSTAQRTVSTIPPHRYSGAGQKSSTEQSRRKKNRNKENRTDDRIYGTDQKRP